MLIKWPVLVVCCVVPCNNLINFTAGTTNLVFIIPAVHYLYVSARLFISNQSDEYCHNIKPSVTCDQATIIVTVTG